MRYIMTGTAFSASAASFAALAASVILIASASTLGGGRAAAFSPSRPRLLPRGRAYTRPPNAAARSTTATALSMSGRSIVVVSPPGGIGEVAAVSAARAGNSVRWFVVSPPPASSSSSSSSAAGGASSSSSSSSSGTVSLPSSILTAISASGGSIELAGASSSSLLLPPEDGPSSVGSVGRWTGEADGLICSFDGIESVPPGAAAAFGGAGKREEEEDEEGVREEMECAVKVAAREASDSAGSGANRVAVLPAPGGYGDDDDDGGDRGGGGLGGILGGLLGGGGGRKGDVPASLGEALGGGAAVTLRYGELFGLPESSPDASPFAGGPRRDPVLRDEYTTRSVRIDPTLSSSGGSMMGSDCRSSRLSVGEAAALLASGDVTMPGGSDVCLTSLRGIEPLTAEGWSEEFKAAEDAAAAGSYAAGGGGGGAPAPLFRASFGSVPDPDRLADWLATKWAPAVLRTYDIAGIRVGARPVYATRSGSGPSLEIVWQKLVDFNSVTVGRMIIDVDGGSVTARRGPGDEGEGFGGVSPAPLAGEDILVRRLADAASQAVEKGLATKPKSDKVREERPKKAPVEPAPVSTTVASSGTVVSSSSSSSSSAEASSAVTETGPRSAGARRSSERSRGGGGTRKRRKSPPRATEGGGEGGGGGGGGDKRESEPFQ